MVTEVDSETHLFRPKHLLSFWERQQKRQGIVRDQLDLERMFCLDDTDSSHPPFDFNPLHDVESLWWLLGYYVLEWAQKEALEGSEDERENIRLSKLRAYAFKLFNDPLERQKAVCNAGKFASIIGCLRGDVRRAGQALEEFRQQLVTCFANSEKDSYTIAHPDVPGLHATIGATIRRVRDILPPTEVKQEDVIPRVGKRSRVDNEPVASPKRLRRARR